MALKKFPLAALVVIVLSNLSPAQESVFKPAQETLTLSDSVERALKNNPRLLVAEKDLAIAKVQSREAESLYYPKINLNMNYVRYRNETLGLTTPEVNPIILEAPLATAEGNRANPLSNNLYLGRLGFVQTLFAGGRIDTTYALSKANIKRADSDFETLKRDVEFQTTKGFGSLVAVYQKEALLKGALTFLEKSPTTNGKSSDLIFEKLKLRTDIRRRLSMLKQEERAVRIDFLQAMGMELFAEVEVTGTLDVPLLKQDLQTLLTWAKENRPDLRQTELQAEVDKLSVHLSLADRYPVFLFGGGVEVRGEEFPLKNSNWNTALTMNIPVFDGFSSLSRIRESRYRAEQSRLKRVRLEDQIEREVRSAFDEESSWTDELVQRKKEAEELKPKAGASLEVYDTGLTADLAVIDARYQLFLARAGLERAVGRHLSE